LQQKFQVDESSIHIHLQKSGPGIIDCLRRKSPGSSKCFKYSQTLRAGNKNSRNGLFTFGIAREFLDVEGIVGYLKFFDEQE